MKRPSKDKDQLSSDKQRSFELLLKERGIDLPPVPALPRRDTSKPCPLSAAQERLWNAWRSGPVGEVYNEVVLVRLLGPLNVVALIQALNEVVKRHEILRTRFAEVDGQIYQYAAAQMNLDVPIADLSRMSAPEREATWRLLSREQVSRAFDLEQLPLIRSSIITLSPHEQLLVVTLHQIVCDGWSRKILVNELSRLYESYVVGNESGLDELKIQYGDFAAWQRARLEAGEMDQDIEYWRGKLGGGLPPTLLAADRISPTARDYKGASREVRLSKGVSERVRQVGRSQGLTAYMILLAAWQVLLSRYSGREEVTVGTTVANRGRAELEVIIGPVSNTLPIKVDLGGNPSLTEVLRRVREVVVEALEHQELPCEWALAEAAKVTGAGRDRVADVMFVMEERIEEAMEFGGLKVIEEKIERGAARSDLAILMRRAGESFEGSIEYSTALFDDETITRMAAAYERLIEVVVSDLDCRVRNLPPLVD